MEEQKLLLIILIRKFRFFAAVFEGNCLLFFGFFTILTQGKYVKVWQTEHKMPSIYRNVCVKTGGFIIYCFM